MEKLVECVPNFSEGRNQTVIQAIADTIRDTDGVELLDVDPGAATNRTVITFIGTPNGVKEAAFRAIQKAAELIDMRKHKGEHARIGATDVCPFVPVSGVTMEDCAQLARELGERVGQELGIPVYLYEAAASRPERRNLANIRKGEYEGLPDKLKDPEWQPDFGPATFNPKSGATVIGAREFLIAYNINLNTRDRKLAHEIALNLRERGRLKRDAEGRIIRDESGKPLRQPGRLKSVKGVGWYIEEYGIAQVSYNLTNYKETPVHVLFEESCKEAEKLGLRVTGSELVGLIPLEAILEAGRYFLKKQGRSTGVPTNELIHIAIKSLGLDDLKPFDAMEKIIEYRFKKPSGPLASLSAYEFANECSTDSPAPGGGSVSALVGSLSASLASMVANLTHAHKDYKSMRPEMEEVAVMAQKLKDLLIRAIDEDTEAFNAMMAAMKLPKKTEEEKAARHQAIQEATKQAILVPFNVMKNAFSSMELCKIVAEKGNKNAVSDAGVGALTGNAAVHGAFLNVKINLPGVEDADFKSNILQEAQRLADEANLLKEEILKIVNSTIDSM